jgi:hypothetical protein
MRLPGRPGRRGEEPTRSEEARPDTAPRPRAHRIAPAAAPPGWDGEPRGEPGIHGVPRSRRWDAVVTVAAELPGEAHAFVVLADASIVPLDDAPAAGLRALVAAVGDAAERPYRAEAVLRAPGDWAVAAVRTRVEELHEIEGDALELVAHVGERSVRVDGRPVFGSFPTLERIAADEGPDVVVRAWRLAGDAWEVEVTPL